MGAITLRKVAGINIAAVDQPNILAPADTAILPGEVLVSALQPVAAFDTGPEPHSIGCDTPSNPVGAMREPRPEPVTSPAYLFNRNEFFIYRHLHLKDLAGC